MRRNQTIALIAIFAALNAVCDSIAGLPQLSSGVWYGWIFLIEPLNGIVLGPLAGFLSTLLGAMIGHSVYLRGEAPLYEYLFTLGAPIGAMISGLLYQRRWKLTFIYFTVLLVAYFVTPIAQALPIWGIWNTLLAFAVLCFLGIFSIRLGDKWLSEKIYALPIFAFIGLEADILFRIFLFIPCQTYQLFYGFTVETISAIWIAAAFITPIQVAISMAMTTVVGPRILRLSPWKQRVWPPE